MSNFIYQSATALAAAIREGKATSTEVVKAHLAQIRKHNSNLNAVAILVEDEALKAAAQCDAEARAGTLRGPLHGVPMTVKEQFWVKGLKCTLNSRMLKSWTAPQDAVVVERLRSAGAVLLGKTNVAKNLTDYQVNGDIYREGKNPYRLAHTPGGSSGGSAAALAAGMTPLELGGDFGGSIRIPANYCGVYGLKPTESTIPGHGVVPIPKGAKGFTFHMAQAGPMARSPEDLELMWQILRGPHSSDRTTPPIAWQAPKHSALQDYRIAWVDGWPGYQASRQTQKVIRTFIATLAKHGCKTEEGGPPDALHGRSLQVFVRLFAQLISQDVPWFIRPLLKHGLKSGVFKGFDSYQEELNQGFKDSFIYYSETMGMRARIVGEWERLFDSHDLLICPASFGPAFKRCKIGTPLSYDGKELVYIKYALPYVACFNASGHPAMNIPLGLDEEGMPVGVQVVGPYWGEPDLLQFAKLVTSLAGGFTRPHGY